MVTTVSMPFPDVYRALSPKLNAGPYNSYGVLFFKAITGGIVLSTMPNLRAAYTFIRNRENGVQNGFYADLIEMIQEIETKKFGRGKRLITLVDKPHKDTIVYMPKLSEEELEILKKGLHP